MSEDRLATEFHAPSGVSVAISMDAYRNVCLPIKSPLPLRGTVTIAETLVEIGRPMYFGPPKTRAGHRTIPLPRVAADPLALGRSS